MNEPYNGWTGGYVTWAVNLWLSNEEWSSRAMSERALTAIQDAEPEDDDSVRFDSKHKAAAVLEFMGGYGPRCDLREWVEENYQLPTEGIAGDLLGSALDDVNWKEIAVSWIESNVEWGD